MTVRELFTAAARQRAGRMRHAAFAYAVVLSLSGCAVSLREASSGPTGCDPGSVEIYDEGGGLLTRTWRARCGYTHYQCSGAMRETFLPFVYDTIGTSCTAIGSTRPPAASTPRLAPRVVSREDEQGRQTFTSVLRQGAFQFVLYGVPALNAEKVAFYIELPPELAGKPCEVGFTADDEAIRSEAFYLRVEKPERIKVVMQSAALRQMAKATSTGGSICERDWQLGEPGQRTLRAFVTEFAKESAKSERRAAGE